jgi:hypothetical protein
MFLIKLCDARSSDNTSISVDASATVADLPTLRFLLIVAILRYFVRSSFIVFESDSDADDVELLRAELVDANGLLSRRVDDILNQNLKS